MLSLKELENKQLLLALETYGTHTAGKRRAARHLGISLSTLYPQDGENSLSRGSKVFMNRALSLLL